MEVVNLKLMIGLENMDVKLKPVIIIAITISLLFIVSSNHDAFAQVQVNVEPYKNSHHIDETNYLTVKINKVIPNTDFCVKTTQNGNSAIYHSPIKLDSSNNNMIVGHTQKIPLPIDFKYGYYTAEVFYGNCSSKDSFGNDSVRILFDAEPSKITKFIQDNYFPEKIDVGTNYGKQGSWNYEKNPFSESKSNWRVWDLVSDYGLMEESTSQVYQSWSVIKISIIQTSPNYDKSIFLDDLSGAAWGEYNNEPQFKCTIKDGYNHARYVKACMKNNIVVILQTNRDNREQLDIFMGAIVDKINSNPIPSSSALSSMYSSQDIIQSNTESSKPSSLIPCGTGTIEKNGQCVANPNYDTKESLIPKINFFDSLIEMFSGWFR